MGVPNFWIEIQTKKSGHKMLSCKIEGKHYIGFLVEKEERTPEGEIYTKEIANMHPCDWEGCSICHPNTVFV